MINFQKTVDNKDTFVEDKNTKESNFLDEKPQNFVEYFKLKKFSEFQRNRNNIKAAQS